MAAGARANREGLALEAGEFLKTWGKGWDGKAHRSEGFHRRVAMLMPEHLVREALAATRDAVERRRSGQGGCHHGPSAYFASVAKKLAEQAGIDLGLRAENGRERPVPAPERPPEARKGPAPHQESEGPPVSMEEAKRGLRELMERLAAERR